MLLLMVSHKYPFCGIISRTTSFAEQIQEVAGNSVEVALVNQGCTGDQPAPDTEAHSVHLKVIEPRMAGHRFVLPPRRWMLERSFTWLATMSAWWRRWPYCLSWPLPS
jgi:hypothetical protein